MNRYYNFKDYFFKKKNNQGYNKSKKEVLSPEAEKILSNTKQILRKPQYDCSEQITNLEVNHKLQITDKQRMNESLIDYGYYRLMGYKKIFLNTYDIFTDDKPDCRWGGKFEKESTDIMLLNLLDFDIKLSSLLLKNILKIEKLLKSRSAYFMADFYDDPFFYLRDHTKIKENKFIFSSENAWVKFINDDYLKILNRGVKYNSNKDYMIHYKNKYHGNLPIWIYLKECSIGDFENFFNRLSSHPKLTIIERTFFSEKTYSTALNDYVDAKDVLNLVTIIRHFRNRCAHGSRIYDFKYNFILKKRSNRKFDFMDDFTFNNKIHINDFVNLLACFLRKDDYLELQKEYKELLDSTSNFENKYRKRLYQELGISS